MGTGLCIREQASGAGLASAGQRRDISREPVRAMARSNFLIAVGGDPGCYGRHGGLEFAAGEDRLIGDARDGHFLEGGEIGLKAVRDAPGRLGQVRFELFQLRGLALGGRQRKERGAGGLL